MSYGTRVVPLWVDFFMTTTYWPGPYQNKGLLRVAHKQPVRVLLWPIRVLPLDPLWAAYGLRARAGSNHYLLVRTLFLYNF